MRRVILAIIFLIGGGWTIVAGDPNAAETYDIKATREMRAEAMRRSQQLWDVGLIPREMFASASVTFHGRAVEPSGELNAEACTYGFVRGALRTIRRRDLYEDKGPQSLLLLHLTSEALTFSTNRAGARALETLQSLGFDFDGLQKNYGIQIHDDFLVSHTIRDAGPDFPLDLRFTGQYTSRKRIRVLVDLLPKAARNGIGAEQANIRLEFLATTGELLAADFPDPQTLAAYGVKAAARITILKASDFLPPEYFSVVLDSPTAQTLAENKTVMLFDEAARQLQRKLGTNQPKCFLLFDNLNAPFALATQMKKFAGTVPWLGASDYWLEDLPFDRSRLEALTRGQRGVGLFAICGDLEVETQILINVPSFPFHGNDEAGRKEHFRDREAAAPVISKFIDGFRFPTNLADHATFLFAPSSDMAFQAVRQMAAEQLSDRALAIDAASSGAEGAGSVYFNGKILTNAIAAIALHGFFPLDRDLENQLRGQPERRLIAGSVYKPIQEIAKGFGRHPLHNMVASLGAENIRLLQAADTLEVIRLNPDSPLRASTPKKPTIEGREIMASKILTRPALKRFTFAVLDLRNTSTYTLMDPALLAPTREAWRPIVAFRVPKTSVTILAAFNGDPAQVVRPNASPTGFYFGGRGVLADLALEAFPADEALHERINPRRGFTN
jgi:hypothetical protein